jgi:hypothetical protein
MRDLVLRNLAGTIDGVNKVFTTPSPYVADTVALWVNGVLLAGPLDNGFIELGGDQIEIKVAPQPGDTLQAIYEPI